MRDMRNERQRGKRDREYSLSRVRTLNPQECIKNKGETYGEHINSSRVWAYSVRNE